MTNNMNEKYYQPEWYSDDGTNIDYGGLPDELFSFQVFHSVKSCREWLEEHDYDTGDFVINEYSDDDIEDKEFID